MWKATRHAARLSLVVLCAAAFSESTSAAPITYEFTLIADTTGPFSGFGHSVSINNAGVVAFNAGLDAGGVGFFTGSGGAITTIADSNGPISTFTGGVGAINDSGTVAFFATLDQGTRGIFAGNGGPLTTIATQGGPFTSAFGFTPSINNAGTVAFTTGLVAGGSGVFTGSGGPVTTVATTAGAFNTVQNPDINNSGAVAFSGAFDTSVANQYVARGTGEPFTIIAQSGSGFGLLGLLNVALNDSGTVAFRASFPGGIGYFTGTGGPATPVTDSTGALHITFAYNQIALNNDGDVAFLAGLDAGGEAIFTGPDAIDDRVIGQGDALFGSTVGHPLFPFLTTGNIGFFRDGINDSGQIAFWAHLTDGREVVVRATPLDTVAVPEPATIASVAAGLSFLSFVGRRARQGARQAAR